MIPSVQQIMRGVVITVITLAIVNRVPALKQITG